MPITVTAPRDVLTAQGRHEVLPRLTATLLAVSGAPGNAFLTSMIGGTVHLLDPSDVYAGGVVAPVVMVELKLPEVGLSTRESRAAFISRATEVVDELTVEGHDPANTWVNVLHARDGAWGSGGRQWTNDDLEQAIVASAAAA